MKEHIIDLNKIRKALPDRAEVILTKYNGSQIGKGTPCIQCKVNNPALTESEFEECKQWQREIVGEAFGSFYTEETGHNWFVFLKRVVIEFRNPKDEDINSWTRMNLVKDGKLNMQD